MAVQDIKIAPQFALWWDDNQSDEENLLSSFINLSEDFYNAILRSPVPLQTETLSALRKSPLAIDVYMWASYRLFTMQQTGQEQVTLSYARLQEQFGTGISEDNYRSFRRELKLAFAKVAKYWQTSSTDKTTLHYDFHISGLTLYRSSLSVAKSRSASLKESEIQRILTNLKFDDATLKQARQIAGDWDIMWLQSQYFDWIKQENVTPKDPRAHFLNFIRTHRKRNGENI